MAGKWLRGDQLKPEAQRAVMSAYVHRHQNPQYRGDEYWLHTYRFKVRTDGRLDQRVRRCEPCYGDELEAGIAKLTLSKLGVR